MPRWNKETKQQEVGQPHSKYPPITLKITLKRQGVRLSRRVYNSGSPFPSLSLRGFQCDPPSTAATYRPGASAGGGTGDSGGRCIGPARLPSSPASGLCRRRPSPAGSRQRKKHRDDQCVRGQRRWLSAEKLEQKKKKNFFFEGTVHTWSLVAFALVANVHLQRKCERLSQAPPASRCPVAGGVEGVALHNHSNAKKKKKKTHHYFWSGLFSLLKWYIWVKHWQHPNFAGREWGGQACGRSFTRITAACESCASRQRRSDSRGRPLFQHNVSASSSQGWERTEGISAVASLWLVFVCVCVG